MNPFHLSSLLADSGRRFQYFYTALLARSGGFGWNRPKPELRRISWFGRAVLGSALLHFQVKSMENLKGKAGEGKPAWFPFSPAVVVVKPLCARRASALLLCPQAGGR